jgi:lysozyme
MKIDRRSIAALSLSAAALVGLVMSEGYSDKAIIPIPGDVPTIGFGSTQGVKMGDKTTPPQALGRALRDVQKFEGAVKRCVAVPLHQYEYDAYVQLSYNIGGNAFCSSTLVRKLNGSDYPGACAEILRWDRAGGKKIPGLSNRRQAEYKQCMGGLQDATMGH